MFSCMKFAYFHVAARKDFSNCSLSITLLNGASIREYEAHWHIKLAPAKITFVVILSFEMALVNSSILLLLPKKVNRYT